MVDIDVTGRALHGPLPLLNVPIALTAPHPTWCKARILQNIKIKIIKYKCISSSSTFPPSLWAMNSFDSERTTNACQSFHSLDFVKSVNGLNRTMQSSSYRHTHTSRRYWRPYYSAFWHNNEHSEFFFF
ncbi:Uncharacterized protein FWK35_00002258 [Aphis craccivora]|uniref:Uncharacterized protein n=1 Tax=Aphis craccivora TaxID=307492 RepID=A0A6G0Z053_APHCR|nr:Uncharacterized protein FWK35_00002258 [Aphis craccivora]